MKLFGMHMSNSTTKPVFVVLFFGPLLIRSITRKASVHHPCKPWVKGII